MVDDTIWQVFHLPGHDTDDIVLYNEKQGILLGGDLILKSITSWLGPPKSDLEAYIKSLAFVLTLPNIKRILPSHGNPVENPHERINSAIDHRKDRAKQILSLVQKAGNKGIAFNELFGIFYPAAKSHQYKTLSGWITVTLDYLVKTGAVCCENSAPFAVYKIADPNFNLNLAWDQLICK